MGPDLEDSTHESLESILDQKIKFWEDDLNISDLLSSANEENWMPREIPSEYDKLALAGLRELGIYDENTKHWALGKLKGDEASTTYATELELAWSRVFNQIVRAITNRGASRTWVQHGNSLIDGRRKPDVVLLPSHFNTTSEIPTAWTDILLTCEVKYKDTGQLLKLAEHQLQDHAYFILSSQIDRELVMGFTLCGAFLRLYLFSRNGQFKSAPIDVHSQPTLLVKLIAMSTYGDPSWLGYDPAYNKSLSKVQVRFQGKWYCVLAVLFHSKGLKGRGTRVMLVQGIDEEDYMPFVLKDTYHNPDWATDGEIHQLLEDPDRFGFEREDPSLAPDGGRAGIPVFIAEETTPLALLESWARVLCPSSSSKEPKKHLRIAFQTCSVGIAWFSCVREFLDAFIGAMEAHDFSYFDKGVLHCDISDTNVWMDLSSQIPQGSRPIGRQAWVQALAEAAVPAKPTDAPEDWYPRRQGMLGDWGFGQDQKCEPSQKIRYLTGTFPFQAIEILEAQTMAAEDIPLHRIHHDLEGCFWVFWICCINLIGPYNQRAPAATDPPDPTSTNEKSPRLDFFPHWARGPCNMKSDVVAFSKQELGRGLAKHISDYFGKHRSLREGLVKMRDLFCRSERPPDVKHGQLVDILRTMRAGINPAEDPFPSPDVVQAGRDRYMRYMARGGVDPPVLASYSSTRTRNPSNKRKSQNGSSAGPSRKKQLESLH